MPNSCPTHGGLEYRVSVKQRPSAYRGPAHKPRDARKGPDSSPGERLGAFRNYKSAADSDPERQGGPMTGTST